MVKQEKVFELKISDEDEISGIDSISLVDEPAIEVNWVAFNKTKKEYFDIPVGEDEKYLMKLMQYGQSEQELIDNGYVIHRVGNFAVEKFFETFPNAESEWNTEEFLVRYKYALNPEATGQKPIEPTTRPFCRDLINKNMVFRIEDMDKLNNDEGDPAIVWRGGYNCRHSWSKILYRKDTKIVNKASVNKGKVLGEGGVFPTDMEPDLSVLGYTQPDTRTSHPSFKKQGYAIPNSKNNGKMYPFIDETMKVYGYQTRYFHICPGAQATFNHLMSMDNDEETIGMIRSAAQIADNVFRIEAEVIEEENTNPEQLMEAMVLVGDFKDLMHEIDEETRMIHDVSYMDGHIDVIAGYLKEEMGYDVSTIVGYVDPGFKPKKKKKGFESHYVYEFETYNDYPDAAKNNACKVLKWRDEHGDEVKGMTRIGWTRANQLCNGENISEDTIARMSAFARHRKNAEVAPEFKSTPWKDAGYVAWLGWGGTSGIEWAGRKLQSIRREKMSKQYFQTDEEKQVVLGPAMIPNLKIFRKDSNGLPYYVYFTAETIKKIAEKYMRNKFIDNNDENHSGKAVEDVYVIESWIKEDMYDKSNKYGYQELPVGTWFVAMKVKNPEIWKKIKSKELNGFSVSGFFEEVSRFTKEEMFLYKVAEILKNIKE